MSESEPLILTLTVTGSQAAQLGPRSRKMFAGKEGSIGRAEDCDWVLSSSGVSRLHAMVRCVNGIYFVEDRSTNGMLLNGSPLVKGDPTALKEGDRLQIDAFDIAVALQQDSETIVQVAPPPASANPAPTPGPPASVPGFDADLLDFGMPAASSASSPDAPDNLIPEAPAEAADPLDPLSLLGGGPPAEAPAKAPAAPAPDWNHSAGMQDHFQPPTTEARRSANMLPADWADELAVPASSAPASAPPVAMPPSEGGPDLATPDPTPAPPVPPAVPQATSPPAALDAIFRIVVDGVMDVLRARAEIKNTFRLPVTVIQKSENNPLKFAMGVDEAMQKILAEPNPAFLSGVAAFDDAFGDIRCHQMAMLAGVRAGFDSLLRHFDPERFERDADSGGRRGFGGKNRYWERYKEHYAGLAADPDECFRRLFGEQFAQAYEEQLARLKDARASQRTSAGDRCAPGEHHHDRG